MTDRIIIALDVPQTDAIAPLLRRMPSAISWGKVGLELFCAEGPRALEPLQARGMKIFLDLKLHDIPRTVERAVRSAASHHVQMITVHASGGRTMMEAAAQAAKACGTERPLLLAVTVLTSMDQQDLSEVGVARTPSDHVRALADLAMEAGIDGLVCSPQEVGSLRQRLGPSPLLVTPGIRMPDDAKGDQKRVATPGEAIRDGASYLVIGRSITDAADPTSAVASIAADMRGAKHPSS